MPIQSHDRARQSARSLGVSPGLFSRKKVIAVQEIELEESRHLALLIVIELFDRQATGIEQVEDRLIDHLSKPQQRRSVNLQGTPSTLH